MGRGIDDLLEDGVLTALDVVFGVVPRGVGVGEGLVGEQVAEGEVQALVLQEVGPVGLPVEEGVGAAKGGAALVDEVVDAVVDEELALDGGPGVKGKAGVG